MNKQFHIITSQIEGQRAALARADAERSAMSKVERIKEDQVCICVFVCVSLTA